MKICVFDVETTGLPEKEARYGASAINTHLWPYVVQLAYVLYDTDENKVTKAVSKIIDIPQEIVPTEESLKVHGITRDKCDKEGVNIKDALLTFFDDCKDVVEFVGHNLDFDSNMLRAECYRILQNMRNNDFVSSYVAYTNQVKRVKMTCTMRENKDRCKIERYWDDGKKYNKFPTLAELHEHLFDTTPIDLHDALVDVLVCLRCFYKTRYCEDINETCDSVLKSIQCTA